MTSIITFDLLKPNNKKNMRDYNDDCCIPEILLPLTDGLYLLEEPLTA